MKPRRRASVVLRLVVGVDFLYDLFHIENSLSSSTIGDVFSPAPITLYVTAPTAGRQTLELDVLEAMAVSVLDLLAVSVLRYRQQKKMP